MQKEYEFLEKIMGTDLSISIVSSDPKIAEEISEKIFSELKSYEEKFSRFIPESELSILNNKKSLKVSNQFIEVISEAKKIFTQTNGFFNPLLQISNHGYDRSFELLSELDDRNLETRKFDTDFDSVVIDSENNLVKLEPNQKLDFGGFLKGFLAEKMARKYFNFSEKISGIIINIGGDIYTIGLDENNQVFRFSIFNPITCKDDISVPIFNAGLATSGTYKRKWKHNGKDFNHILDKSGDKNPETENVSVSIINKSGSKADSYTKIFFSSPPEQALKIVNDETKYIIINNKGEVTKNLN